MLLLHTYKYIYIYITANGIGSSPYILDTKKRVEGIWNGIESRKQGQ